MKVDFIFISQADDALMPYVVRRSRRPIRKLPFGSLLVGKEPHDRLLDSTSDFARPLPLLHKQQHADTVRAGLGVFSIAVFPCAGALYLSRHLSTEVYAVAVLIALSSLIFALFWRT